MKHEEELAKRYLHSLGLSDVVHEPDGNIPPDFVVDGKIAVEVRRLNQHEAKTHGKPAGLENLRFALEASIREVLRSLGPPKNEKSWFVHYSFSRPLPALPDVKHAVQRALVAFRDGRTDRRELSISDRLKLHLLPSTKLFPQHFVPGGSSDHDSGGWLVHELQRNIDICIQEKTGKIASVRARYPEWWLVLIDQIGYGERESVKIEHDWDKVVLLNPLNPTSGYEI
jgi:hypothetical protein